MESDTDSGMGNRSVSPIEIGMLRDFGLALFAMPVAPELKAGDANQDLQFGWLDLVQVQIGAKYLTGQAATCCDGDWNGAPGGQPGNPPAGDGLFNQFDIMAAQQGDTYPSGPYATIQTNGEMGDAQTSVIYNAGTGEVAVDTPAGVELTSINIDSTAGIFTGETAHKDDIVGPGQFDLRSELKPGEPTFFYFDASFIESRRRKLATCVCARR